MRPALAVRTFAAVAVALGLLPAAGERATLAQRDQLWHMLVSPEHKLMVCKIYKCGSTQLSQLFSTLWRDPDRVALWKYGRFDRSAEGCKWMKRKWQEYPVPGGASCHGRPAEAITLHQFAPLDTNASALASDPAWTKVIVARDPLERFISGSLEKCGVHLNAHCPVREEVWELRLAMQEAGWAWPDVRQRTDEAAWVRQAIMTILLQKLESIAEEKRKKGINWGFSAVDAHFKPSSCMCGAAAGLQFDRLVLYNPRNFSTEVRKMLQEVGVPDADAIVTDWEVLTNVSNNQSTSSGFASAEERTRELLPPELARRVVHLYAEDYRRFPSMRELIPEWVGATLPPIPTTDVM